jgi:hypothetical protein
VQHFLYSLVLSFFPAIFLRALLVYRYNASSSSSFKLPLVVGFVFSLSIGVLKEVLDSQSIGLVNPCPCQASVKDLVADLLGCSAGSLLFNFKVRVSTSIWGKRKQAPHTDDSDITLHLEV